eukprot:TRINITY_DN5849_c0_g2_i1.p1 TRINITY_DN5849_c0_g2~~TRINITY_DN5849_c0_g2_i1.p1  ORF type:complete len:690 (-),score=86.22 TRINITY_DN5849_c0_g2_i1:133-2202(-)
MSRVGHRPQHNVHLTLGKRKQRLYREVAQFFFDMDALVKPERLVEKKKVKSKLYKTSVKSFMDQMESGFVKRGASFKARDVQWAEVFHYRMQIHRDVLGEARYKKYEQMVRFYHKQLSDMGRGDKSIGSDIAIGFLGFLSTHRFDPDSCLARFTPHPEVLAKYSFFIENPLGTTPATTPPFEFESETSRDNLAATIIKWSQLENQDRLAKELRRLSSILQTAHYIQNTIKPGDMAIALTPAAGPIYVRFSGKREHDKMGFYLTPEERSEEMLSTSKLLPLTPDITSCVDLSQLRPLVRDPVVHLLHEVSKKIKYKALDYLRSQHFDLTLADNARLQKISLRDMSALKSNYTQLVEFQAKPPESFLHSINEFAQQQVLSFVSSLGPYDLFYPTCDEVLLALENTPWHEHLGQSLRRYMADHKRAIAILEQQIKDLLDGTTKTRITAWWLSLIKTECEKFLGFRGYMFDAVPIDYIEQPPVDFQAVRDNFALIKEILNQNEDKHQMQALVKRIKNTVYPEIDQFIENAKLVLAGMLNLQESANHTLDQFKERFQQEKERFSEENRAYIGDLMQDMRYLDQMRVLEDAPAERVLDIVPVTGLVVGRFYRLENELRTVLEHWADTEEMEQKGEGDDSSDFAFSRTSTQSPSYVASPRHSSLSHPITPPQRSDSVSGNGTVYKPLVVSSEGRIG